MDGENRGGRLGSFVVGGLLGASATLAAARRKAELLHFARRAARRLASQIDPTLGEGR